MGFTQNQQNAIDVRDRTLLVSAAAGSGKTFTLTQRIIRSIIDDGQDLSRLLIVTFTRAAASELKAKIARAVSEAIAENPQNMHLQNQLIKLGSSNISTIDSFFMEPVRSNFEKLGLPASIRMADDAELAPLKEKLMREVLDEFFDRCEAYRDGGLSDVGYSDRYTELVGVISEVRTTARLIPTLCDIYAKLLTSPEGISQIKKHADRLRDGAERDFFNTKEGSILKNTVVELAQYGANTMSMWYDRLSTDPDVPSNMLLVFDENKTACTSLAQKLQSCTYEEAIAAFEALSFGRLVVRGVTSDLIEDAKKARKSVSDSLGKVHGKYLFQSQSDISQSLITYAEISYVLYDIIKSFDVRYRKAKLDRGICEFSDMPIFMLKLLLDEDGQPSEYAKQLSHSFDAVYIDEYQDVNEIQDRIFSLIGQNRRFMVGDIKQSIYGFREAEPSIFAEYRKNFPTYDKENDNTPSEDGGNTIFMSENFRCDECVIEFTNLICSGVFSAFAQSIGYTKDDDLKFAKGRPFEAYQSPKTVINIVHTPEMTKNEESADSEAITDEVRAEDKAKNTPVLADEAIVVANQIAELLRKEKNADGTPIRAGDIAVLVRSNSTAKPLLSALSRLNIKYSLSSKTELFETDEMKLLVALLESIDNPRYDMPLCHLLSGSTESFVPMFSFEEVVMIRKAADASSSLYDAVIAYAEDGEDIALASRCKKFVSLMDKMRSAASKLSADKMVKSLSFDPLFCSLSQSAAYTFLYDSVCKYVKNNWNSLHSFLIYFKDLMESGTVGGEPDKSKKDAVTVMTIHQSKGLEFNVCFLFGFGKKFNLSNKYPILFDKDFGVTLKLPPRSDSALSPLDRIRTRYEETPMWKIIGDSIKQKQIEEEARVFYVALTRARERLYISATVSKDFEEYKKSLLDCADYSFEIKKGTSYINWILLTMANSNTDNEPYTVNLYANGENHLTFPFPKSSMMEINDNVNPHDMEFAKLYNKPFAQSEEDKLLSLIPSKVAASKVRPNMLDSSVFIPVPTGKLFSESDEDIGELSGDDERQIRARIELMRSQKTDFDSLLRAGEKPTAAERGTAMHRFLQFCDYDSLSELGIMGEIKRLEDQRFISTRTASILDEFKLRAFFDSDLYDKIKTAKKVHREFHFRMFRPASDFTENNKLKKLAADKMIFIQGSIDLVVEASDGSLVLCDYKTDRISSHERQNPTVLSASMRERHGEQLSQYSYAIEHIFGKKPDKIYLFLLSIGECIEI